MKAVIAVLAGSVLAAAGCAAASAQPAHSVSARPAHRACATVVLAQQTVTGHEADLPIALCGGMRPGSWTCYVTPWGPLQADSRLDCSRQH